MSMILSPTPPPHQWCQCHFNMPIPEKSFGFWFALTPDIDDVSMKAEYQCVHKRQRARCFKCGGNGLCTHGRQRNRCSECGGKGLCKHARRKEDCKDCSTRLCVHLRRRYSCVDCGGAGTCEHKVIRSTCKQCGGRGLCEHGKRRCRCKQCQRSVPARKQPTSKRSHSDRSNAIVSLEQCLFNDVTVMHLTSADLNVVARAVKSAELADLTDAGRTLRQCVFTSHNCKKSKTQLQLRPSASLLGSLSVITLKKIGPGECIGILGGERISLKHTGCVANEQNNNNFVAGIPWTDKLPNHAFSMKNRGSILRYANHGCFEKANSRFLASGISVEVWSKKTIPEGSEVNVHFFYGPAIIVCSCRSLLITPLLPKLTTQWRGRPSAVARAPSAEGSCISSDCKGTYTFIKYLLNSRIKYVLSKVLKKKRTRGSWHPRLA